MVVYEEITTFLQAIFDEDDEVVSYDYYVVRTVEEQGLDPVETTLMYGNADTIETAKQNLALRLANLSRPLF